MHALIRVHVFRLATDRFYDYDNVLLSIDLLYISNNI